MRSSGSIQDNPLSAHLSGSEGGGVEIEITITVSVSVTAAAGRGPADRNHKREPASAYRQIQGSKCKKGRKVYERIKKSKEMAGNASCVYIGILQCGIS